MELSTEQYKAFYKLYKMEWENIILIGVCFAIVVVVTYYFWKKSTSQTQQIAELSKRLEAIELSFAPQPSQSTLDKFFPVSSQSHIPQTHIYAYMPQHVENVNEQKIIDLTTEDKTHTSSISSQTEDHDLTPFVLKSDRRVDLEAITDNLLPVISSK